MHEAIFTIYTHSCIQCPMHASESFLPHFRDAIGTLLSSVQTDKCLTRRASTKRRITQYITKVEMLLASHKKNTKNGEAENNFWSQQMSRSPSNMADFSLFGDWPDLKRYRIVDALSSKVLLGRDQSDSGVAVALKVVPKSLQVLESSPKCLLPVNIPNMCPLVRYYESEDVLILVIQHSEGGRLYDRMAHVFDLGVREDSGRTQEESKTRNSSVIKPSRSFIRGRESHFDSTRSGLSSLEVDEDLRVTVDFESDDRVARSTISPCARKEPVKEDDYDSPNNYDELDPAFPDEEELEDIEEGKDLQVVCDSKEVMANLDQQIERDNSTPKPVNRLPILSQIDSEYFSPSGGGDRSRRGSFARSPYRQKSMTRRLSHFSVNPKGACLPPLSLLRKWAGQLCGTLLALHSRGLVIKDLNPANLMLDNSNDLVLTYQFEWSSVNRELDENAVNCFYVAPEVSFVAPLSPACDWWSVGVLLFELATGSFFVESYPSGLANHIQVAIPNEVDKHLANFISSCIRTNPLERIHTENRIKAHPLFSLA